MTKSQILYTMAEWMGVHHWGGEPRSDCKIDTVNGCHLWMWATDSYLQDALWIMNQLGFRYIRTLQWIKMRDLDERADGWEGTLGDVCRLQLQIGLGQYLRGSHEMALLGVRGESMVPPTEKRMPSVVFAERGRHSSKPDEAIQVFESVSPGPRLECFGRAQRDGWDVIGNEVA